MKILRALALSLCLASCDSTGGGTIASGPDAASAVSIVGSWVDIIDSNNAVQMVFTSSTFKETWLFALTDGRYAVEIDSGDYIASGGNLALTLTASSCPNLSRVTKTGTFSRQGNALTLTLSTSYLVFQLDTTAPAGMGSATIGCTDSAGNFTPHPVATLP